MLNVIQETLGLLLLYYLCVCVCVCVWVWVGGGGVSPQVPFSRFARIITGCPTPKSSTRVQDYPNIYLITIPAINLPKVIAWINLTNIQAHIFFF